MNLWKEIKKHLGTLGYLELAVFTLPLVVSRRHPGRSLLPIKGPGTPEEEAQGLLRGDVALAEKLIEKWRGLAIRANQIYSNISVAWILAVIHAESRGIKHLVSPAGAEGLMQLMPAAQQDFGVSDPFDPWDNIEGGTHVLSFLSNRYKGDVFATMVAYNWGYGNYDNAVKKRKHLPKDVQTFANRVIALYRLYHRLGA